MQSLANHGQCDVPFLYITMEYTGTIRWTLPVQFFLCDRKDDGTYAVSGLGYTSGSYNASNSGILIIQNVTTEHERTFLAVLVDLNYAVTNIQMVLNTAVSPVQEFPFVTSCGQFNSCLISSDHLNTLNCTFHHTRPAVTLRWYINLKDRYEFVEGTHFVVPDGKFTFSSILVIDVNRLPNTTFATYVCEAFGPSLGSRTCDTNILIDKSTKVINNEDMKNVVPTYLSVNSQINMPCSKGNFPKTFVWRKRTNYNSTETLMFSLDGKRRITSSVTNWEVLEDGSLFLPQVDIRSSGNYTCEYPKGNDYETDVYNVILLVPPSPPFLIVDGCSMDTHDCVVTLHNKTHNLTCSVSGVSPLLSLKFSSNDPLEVTVVEKNTIVSHADMRYDVKLYSEIHIIRPYSCNTYKTIVCTASGPGSLALNVPSKNIKIALDTFEEGCLKPTSATTDMKNVPLMLGAFVFAVTMVLVNVLIFIYCAVHKYRKKKKKKENKTNIILTRLPRSSSNEHMHTDVPATEMEEVEESLLEKTDEGTHLQDADKLSL